MPFLDLNCDLGESFGAYTIGSDEAIIPYITSANIACGYHAGDPTVMHRSVALCRKYGVQVGAHPGLPDLMGFGRRKMQIAPAEAADCVAYQIGALQAFCQAGGGAPPPREAPRCPLQHGRQGPRPGRRHLPGGAKGGPRGHSAGPLGQRDGGGGQRHRPAGGLRGLCRPGLPARRDPCAPRPARRHDHRRGRGHRPGGPDG